MKIKNLKSKLIDLLAIAGVVGIFFILDLPCVFQALFRIPCPGCGMTRAYISLLRFDIQQAFAYHPMFWSVPILLLLYLTDGKLFRSKWANRLLLIALLAGFLLNWIIRLFML